MTDHLTLEQRSENMRRIKSADTAPEMAVRHAAHALGFRYRLHRRDLPGNPDLAFIARKKVVFVHGCFWHHHRCRKGSRTPKTNVSYWSAKIRRNVTRDKRNTAALRRAGWRILTIWGCETNDIDELKSRLQHFLSEPSKAA